MKVLFIHNRLMAYRETIFKEFANYFNVDFVITDSPKTTDLRNIKFLPYKAVPMLSYEIVPGLLRSIYESNPDLIVTTDATYYISHVVSSYCRRHGVPYVLWTEQWSASLHPRRILMRRIERKVFSGAQGVLALGTAAAEYAVNSGFSGKNLIVAFNTCPPLPLTRDAVERADRRGPLNVLYLSRLVRYKGVRTLARAARLAQQERLPIRFTIAGAGYEESWLNRFVKRYGVTNIQLLFRYINSEEKQHLMNQTDALVLPSIRWGKTEAWGLVMNEALSVGKYIISSDLTGGGKDLIRSSRDGLIFRANSPTSLLDALRETYSILSASNNELERRNRYLRSFNERQLVEGLIQVCTQCLISR